MQSNTLTHVAQNLSPLSTGETTPSLASLLGLLNKCLRLSNRGQLILLEDINTQLGALGTLKDRTTPCTVTCQ